MLTSHSYDHRYYDEHKAAGLDYAVYGDWQRDYGHWFVDALWLRSRVVLDVGCACGAIANGIKQAGAFVVCGIDLSEHMVKIGREKFSDVRLNVCDAANIHLFREMTFDAIHSAQVAEHWPAELVPRILAELRRVTRPGGKFFCALDTVESFERQGRNILNEDPTHVTIKPMAWWHERLQEAGWKIDSEGTRWMRDHPLYQQRFAVNDWDWFLATRPSSDS